MELKYFIFCLFAPGYICSAQQHTDLQEYGLKGNLRKATIYNYWNVPASLNKDSAVLYDEEIFYFNKQGNTDSVLSFTGSGPEDELIKKQKTTITYRNGRRSEVVYNYTSGETDTVQRMVLNDSTYKTNLTSKTGGQTTFQEFHLDKDYRVYKTQITVLDQNKKPVLTQSNEICEKDNSGFYHTAICSFSDLDNGAKKKTAIIYSGFDRYGNPQKTVLTHTGKDNKLEMRRYKFEYY
ncbi:hypothetical protein A8C56_21000 [Niabella ginsenosidivorans]|uniref:Uncharacterized protein n=1 Tax=Niabella ginsenosidivorans TaxID=1176587 RepID=A0A1A9I602_9BACT|nr:hypothetical protein [Niabella ginsenosidivorans]ANH83127.1 hypothetical protein A8C56_21000 [Niabella ginsenosidivorans]